MSLPLRPVRYLEEDLSFSINSDDPGIMRSELVRDYQAAVERFGLPRALLPQTVRPRGGHVCMAGCFSLTMVCVCVR